MKKFLFPVFFIIVISSITFFSLFWSYRYSYPYNKYTPKAVHGLVDFTKFDFNENRTVKLLGESEFYWNKLLTPTDFDQNHKPVPDCFFYLPGVWTDVKLNGNYLPSYGYATFRLLIKIDSLGDYGLKFKEFDCAYKVWVDGKLMAEIGKVGDSPANYLPSWKRSDIYFEATSDTIELVIQIANFTHRKGGPEDVIYFGKKDNIKKYKDFLMGTSYFLLGVLVIITIYHLVLYMLRPQKRSLLYFSNRSLLYFSIFCWLIILRLLTTGEKIIIDIFPHLSFPIIVRTEYISYMMAMPFFFSFMSSFFVRPTSKKWYYLAYWTSFSVSIVVLVCPVRIFSYTPIFFHLVVLFFCFYTLIRLTSDLVHKLPNTYILFSGYFFFFIIIVNDILYYNHIVSTSHLLPLGLFVLIISQAFVLSRISSLTFNHIERLSMELDIKNCELEIKVLDRTREILQRKEEIEQQKAILQTQANNLQNVNEKLLELDKFKESMTSMLVHDLKNPLNVILNLSKENMVLYAGHQMLNLIENLLDVQKYENSIMTINPSFESINYLINSAHKQIAFLCDKKTITFTNEIDRTISFQFDPELIERVFINLFTNAIKHAPHSSVIRLSFQINDNRIIFKIADQGPGIPDDKQDILFSRYGQIIPRKSGLIGSSGLGLAFCKLAIEAHSGTIGYSPNQPNGSIFWFDLPFTNGIISDEKEINSNALNQDRTMKLLNENLSDSDRIYLKTFADKLVSFQIFEVSDINHEIKKIDKEFSTSVALWKQLIQKAIITINQNQYDSLLNLIVGNIPE